MMHDFFAQAQTLRDSMIARRRDFHQHPELSFQEVRTAGIVAQKLSELGLEVRTGVGKTGVVGLLEGDREGPTVLLRCDMDALPVQEENEVEYRSETPNKMHACGHDGHTAVALAVAEMMAQQRKNLTGNIKFVFQPAEEIGKGALAMIDDGVLLDPVPQVSLGLHLWNEIPVGEVAVVPGPLLAGVGIFDLVVKGRGGHAAMPNYTLDPVLTLAHILTAVQSIISRNVPPVETAVISVTKVHAGDAYNVIPERAKCAGTIRFFRNEIGDLLVKRFHEVANGVAASMGCEAELTIEMRSGPVINDAAVAGRLTDFFSKTAPNLKYRDRFMSMVGEDMAYFLERVPGVFLMVGSANHERGLDYAHHHPRFDFDEESMVIGAALLATAAAEYVLPE
jgi:amidohydrolase